MYTEPSGILRTCVEIRNFSFSIDKQIEMQAEVLIISPIAQFGIKICMEPRLKHAIAQIVSERTFEIVSDFGAGQ
jgi:hypothetical protein